MREETLHVSPFEQIKQVNDEGQEFWSARELAKVLGYTRYDKFQNAIQKAEVACVNSRQAVEDHMSRVRRMISTGKGARREVEDVYLSRYACYLIIENADPSKEIVALGQTYFAVQAYKQEELERFEDMSEERRRLFLRDQLLSHTQILAQTASGAGVITKMDFAIFQEHGYRGLYGGEKIADIQQRKGLKQEQDVMDFMGSVELAANLFRSTLTEAKLKIDQVSDKATANETHFKVGVEVRETIKRIDGTLPENLPTPSQSISELRGDEGKLLKPEKNLPPAKAKARKKGKTL
jgi:DNA-damage-inducible protein D